MYTVIDKARREDVELSPFPHIVIDNCLPEEIYKELANCYPTRDYYTQGNLEGENERIKVRLNEILDVNSKVPSVWSDFFKNHISEAFYIKLLELFGSQIKASIPDIEDSLSRKLEEATLSVHRPNEKITTHDLLFDHDLGINTPSSRISSVRGPHIDGLEKLFGGVMYFRMDSDDAEGGDLGLYSWKTEKPIFYRYTEALPADVILEKTVSYKPNTVVLWLNSPNALHGVSARSPSSLDRRLVYFSARMNPKKFPNGLYPEYFPKRSKSYIKRSAKRLMNAFR